MFFDIGLPPIFSLLIAVVLLAILSDFLLELFSVRMSLSTGKLQSWLFDHVGQNIFSDFVIAACFQFFSFRKKAYFMQLSSLINVGSFTRKQTFILLLGSFIGVGLSLILLMPGYMEVGVLFCFFGFFLNLFSKEQLKDFGVSFLGLGLFLIGLHFFNYYLEQSNFDIHPHQIGEGAVIGLIFFSTIFFRTPVAFLLFTALLHYLIGFSVVAFPFLLLLNSVVSMGRLYGHVLKGWKRLRLALVSIVVFQILQFAVSLILALALEPVLAPLLESRNFLEAWQVTLGVWIFFYSLSLLIISPLAFLLTNLPLFDMTRKKKVQNQKIIYDNRRGSCFSIHLSMFLLRQEFKKFTTSVHTVVKISREVSQADEKLNKRLVRYQAMLVRVGDELKELCFCIGRQRSYGWHIKEIMSYYRHINQIELLIEDLAQITNLLLENRDNEEWDRECRFWLGLQLKIFESFFNHVVGVGKDEAEKVQANIDKSYEILDRFFGEAKTTNMSKSHSKSFYRITESIGNLAL